MRTSFPAPSARGRLTLSEPLGDRVVTPVETDSAPLRLIVTPQRTPLRFWATSSSGSWGSSTSCCGPPGPARTET